MLTKGEIEEMALGLDTRGEVYDKLIYDFCPSDIGLKDLDISECRNWEKCSKCWELARKEG